MSMRKLVDRGIDWVGAAPVNWQFKKGKYLFQQRSERGNTIELQLLSPTQKYGCIPQSLYEELTGANAVKLNEKTDLNLLKTIHRGDFCISLRSFQGGFEYSDYEGVVSPAYQVFYPTRNDVYRGYYKYMFKDGAFIVKMNSFTLSLRDGKNIAFADFGNTLLPLPSVEEQRAIADYLDKKTSEIDAAIKEAQELIEKYKAYKQSVITEAVTKGLDPQVSMKDSGVKWIGKIPKHWTCSKQKYEITLLNGRAYKDSEFEEDGKYKVLRVGNLFTNPLWYTSSLELDANKYCQKGDLLYSWSMSYAPVIWNGEKVIYHYHIWKTVLSKKINKMFAYYYFISLTNALRAEIHETTMGFITMGIMNNSNLAFPSISEQRSIATYLDKKCGLIDSAIAQKENLISKLQEYKKSIIFEYVTGKKEVPNG